MRDKNYDYLGVGFKFPLEVDENTGKMKTVSYERDIEEAIYIILMTRPGERIMNPKFGCQIHDFSFGTMDYRSITKMKKVIENALTIWEPRISNIQVTIDEEQVETGKLLINIDYIVRNTNNPNNLVFPYYINEGFDSEVR